MELKLNGWCNHQTGLFMLYHEDTIQKIVDELPAEQRTMEKVKEILEEYLDNLKQEFGKPFENGFFKDATDYFIDFIDTYEVAEHLLFDYKMKGVSQ